MYQPSRTALTENSLHFSAPELLLVAISLEMMKWTTIWTTEMRMANVGSTDTYAHYPQMSKTTYVVNQPLAYNNILYNQQHLIQLPDFPLKTLPHHCNYHCMSCTHRSQNLNIQNSLSFYDQFQKHWLYHSVVYFIQWQTLCIIHDNTYLSFQNSWHCTNEHVMSGTIIIVVSWACITDEYGK